jgi:hypothetical protein
LSSVRTLWCGHSTGARNNMSTSLHQYPQGFGPLHTPNDVDLQQRHVLIAQHTGLSRTNHLQYDTLQFHRHSNVSLSGNAVGKPHRLPYANGPLAAAPRTHRGTMLHDRSGRASGLVRRRISRACDQCNQLRTKCDGQKCMFPQMNRKAHADDNSLFALYR